MNHKQMHQWVSFFIDGQASDEQRRAVLVHLESCIECRTRVRGAAALREGIRLAADVELPATFPYGVLRTIRRDQEQARTNSGVERFGIRVVLSLLLIVICLFGLGSLYQPEQPSLASHILAGEPSDSLSKRVLEPQRDISKDDIIYAAISK